MELLFVGFLASLPVAVLAQQSVVIPDAASGLPDAPLATGALQGTVVDASGASVVGATVTIEEQTTKRSHTGVSDSTGFFRVAGIGAGTFKVTIGSPGFAMWEAEDVVMHAGEDYELPRIELRIAATNSTVDAMTQSEVAEEQIKLEEKQRVLGVVPNFYVSYVWKPAPMTTKQKFKLAWRTTIDPMSFVGSGVTAGIEQWQNTFSGYGQGAQGYGKRFGASLADGFIGNMFGNAIFPALFRQDPRYLYKGTGSIRARALYAIATVVICRGDNGKWEPNYSNVLGNLAAGGMSNLYFPASDRQGAQLTIENALIRTGSGAISSLLQEFLVRRITRGGGARTTPAVQAPASTPAVAGP